MAKSSVAFEMSIPMKNDRGGGPQRFHSFEEIYGFYSKSADCRTLNTPRGAPLAHGS
jgi:hypothetical protein